MINSPQASVPASLLEELGRTTDAHRLEVIADTVSVATDPRAVRPLLWRLGDSVVQDDPDVEDAVCSALVTLGVMRTAGNRTFALRPENELDDQVLGVLHEFAVIVPRRYRADGPASGA